MNRRLENTRLAVTGTLSSALVVGAGTVALQGRDGIFAASVLLTVAIVAAGVGTAYAADRRLGWGLAVLIAAVLPLFLGLHAVGAAILRALGPGVAGGLLLVLGGAIVAATLWLWWRVLHRGGRHP